MLYNFRESEILQVFIILAYHLSSHKRTIKMRRTISRVLSSTHLKCIGSDHSSGPQVTLRPQAALPGDYTVEQTLISLFGLAPDRVCHTVFVAESVVGFYPTVSPLPLARMQMAVYFLLHCPSQPS